MKSKKFNIFKNIGHSIDGVRDIWKNETAFRIECLFFVLLTLVAIFLPISFAAKAILILSMPLVLIAEIINSAIERTVDTITLEYDENAKRAKDAASSIVLFAIVLVFAIWTTTLWYELKF